MSYAPALNMDLRARAVLAYMEANPAIPSARKLLLLVLAHEGERTVGMLAAVTGLSQQSVSSHLHAALVAGVVARDREDKSTGFTGAWWKLDHGWVEAQRGR